MPACIMFDILYIPENLYVWVILWKFLKRSELIENINSHDKSYTVSFIFITRDIYI